MTEINYFMLILAVFVVYQVITATYRHYALLKGLAAALHNFNVSPHSSKFYDQYARAYMIQMIFAGVEVLALIYALFKLAYLLDMLSIETGLCIVIYGIYVAYDYAIYKTAVFVLQKAKAE